MKLPPRDKLVLIGLVAFSFIMLLMPSLPTGYSSNAPNQFVACSTSTVAGTSELVTTITSTGSQASAVTVTIGTTTHLLETIVSTDISGSTTACVVVSEVNVLLGLVITVVIIAEYPYGLPLLVIFMVIAYGLIKRRTRNRESI